MGTRSSSAHPLGSGCIDGDLDEHVWEPLSFRFEAQLLDDDGRVLIRQPAIDDAHVYFICMKCRGWTYGVFEWVGFFLGNPPDFYPAENQPHPGAKVVKSMATETYWIECEDCPSFEGYWIGMEHGNESDAQRDKENHDATHE